MSKPRNSIPEIHQTPVNGLSSVHGQADKHAVAMDRFTLAGGLVAIGIVFGDIGTSPLYTYSAIIGEQPVNELLVLGGVSCIFWTLFFQTTLKYVLITLRADNKGEGGIFSLYTLIRRYAKWLMIPAILGGSFLIADSVITPPISVSAAIEGLRIYRPDLPTVPIVIAILVGLFSIQWLGTKSIGKIFGPVMMGWFTMIGVLGLGHILQNPSVLKALSPHYAYQLLVQYPGGFWLLGGVFLCTTGAEALYSDLGHCGRRNIQISWIYVKTCLLLCYLGQAVWLLEHTGVRLTELNGLTPFYGLVPQWFLIPAIAVATLATVIASQALISGTFTLLSEAIRLNLFPKQRIVFPTDIRGQLYVPALNWVLLAGCIGVVLFFRESKNMEAAFGLSVTLTMLMTTVLLSFYLYVRHTPGWLVAVLLAVFLSIELSFLVANLLKFSHGGWVTLLAGLLITGIMWVWNQGAKIKQGYLQMKPLEEYIPVLRELSNDTTIPKYATHLVYLTASNTQEKIEKTVLDSIFKRQPKRADVYWFIHVDVVDEPYKMAYSVHTVCPDDVVWVTFRLGFRIVPRIGYFLRKVVKEMVERKEVTLQSRYPSLEKTEIEGDFRFVVIERFLSFENELSFRNSLIMNMYFLLKRLSLSDEKSYGLDYSNVTVEKSPLVIAAPRNVTLVREN